MRHALIGLVLGLFGPVLAMADSAPRAQVTLECPSGATAQRLCALLATELSRQGRAAGTGAAIRLRLQLRASAGNILFARLLVEGDGPVKSGPELELSVVDHTDIPEAALKQFAAQLVRLAPRQGAQ